MYEMTTADMVSLVSFLVSQINSPSAEGDFHGDVLLCMHVW